MPRTTNPNGGPMTKQITITLGVALSIAACAAPEPGTPAFTAQLEQKKQEARVDAVKSSISDLPSWFTTPPTDENAVYAAGTATSSDLQFAQDKAVLAAKRSLADRINSKLSAKMKDFISESVASENAPLLTHSERVTQNLITEVNLSGYAVKETKFIPSGPQYRVYVLLQYPLGNANRFLVEQVNKDTALETQLQASKAYQELEADIRDARAQKSQP